jgi:hypothetical protein
MDKPKAAKGCGGVRKQTMLWIVQAAGVRKESGRLTDRPTVQPPSTAWPGTLSSMGRSVTHRLTARGEGVSLTA